MARRKKKAPKKDVELPRIEPADYWKWRLALETLEHEETRLRLIQKEARLHHLEFDLLDSKREVIQLKESLTKKVFKEQKSTSDAAQDEYTDIKTGIEKKLGLVLDGCEISPVDFTIRRGEETKGE